MSNFIWKKEKAGYSLIKLPLHSEMADTNSKTYKATLPVMAHNLCTKPFLSQEPEDSSTPREAANHSTDYSCLAFHTIWCQENKIRSVVSKQRGSWEQQWWPRWQVPPGKPLVGWWRSPVSPQDGSWQESTSALLFGAPPAAGFLSWVRQIMGNVDPEAALSCRAQNVRTACVITAGLFSRNH